MILFGYLFRKLLLNSFAITIGLTFLFNLIEFFEKLVRVNNASTSAILYFIALSLIPSFFENMTIGTWLGACMTLKEMDQQNEWETIQLLNIKKKSLYLFLLAFGLFMATISFFGKEFIALHLANKAEHFNKQEFKRTTRHRQWFALNNNRFCSLQGTTFCLFKLSDNGTIDKVTTTDNALFDPENKNVHLTHGTIINNKTHSKEQVDSYTLFLPGLFSQQAIEKSTPSLGQLLTTILFDKSSLPPPLYNHLLYQLWKRILAHLLLILLPLLTFSLFFLFPYGSYKWLLFLLPYPLATLLLFAADALASAFPSGIIAFMPSLLLLALFITTKGTRK